MHAVFWLNGIKRDVDEVIKFLETRSMRLKVKTSDGKEHFVPIQGSLRYGLFGTWEYVFPETEKDPVLTMLRFDGIDQQMEKFKNKLGIAMMQRLLSLESIPPFEKNTSFFMPQEAIDNVRIIPLGVRYDLQDHTFANGLTHEYL